MDLLLKTIDYESAIKNVAIFIRSEENRKEVNEGRGLNIFQASEILSIVFFKSKEDVTSDFMDFLLTNLNNKHNNLWQQ